MINRTYVFLAIASLALASCAEKLICPAYQSSFIHSKDELRKKFSYFDHDTIPKVLTASKTKYLIAVPESYRKRYRKMQTVAMRPIYTVLEDSSDNKDIPPSPLTYQKQIDSIALVGIGTPAAVKVDSTAKAAEDSIYVITKDKEVRILRYNFPDSLKYDSASNKYVREKAPYYHVDEVGYNVEQENYMWYFRKELILPDVRLSKLKQANKVNPAGTDQTKPVEKKGFFQRLMFWKKDKPKTDSLNIAPVGLPKDSLETNEFDFDAPVDSTAKKSVQPVVEPKKKGLKGLFKKKTETPADPNKSPAKKEDEQGF